MDHNSMRKLVEGQLLRLEGNAFQDCMDRLGLELYPGDYQPVRAAGPRGDTKNDGYCPKARVFFAAHATRGERIDKTKAKIRGDLKGCLAQYRNVKVWRFLTNDTLPGEIERFIDDELRPAHPGVTIEVWGLKTLASEICKLDGRQVERIVDVLSIESARSEVIVLAHVKTGRDVWPILSDCMGWMEHIEPDDCTEDEQDLIDSTIQALRDWSDIAGDIEFSRSSVRDAQRSISTSIENLREIGIVLYAGMLENAPLAGGPVLAVGSVAVFKLVRVLK